MNIQTATGDLWVVMLVNCKECEEPLRSQGERIRGICEECECKTETPDVFDPYGQIIFSEA